MWTFYWGLLTLFPPCGQKWTFWEPPPCPWGFFNNLPALYPKKFSKYQFSYGSGPKLWPSQSPGFLESPRPHIGRRAQAHAQGLKGSWDMTFLLKIGITL